MSLNGALSRDSRNNQVIYGESEKTEPLRVLQVVTIMTRGGLESFIMNVYRKIDRSKIQFDFLCHRMRKGDFDDEIVSLGGQIYRTPPLSIRNLLGYYRNLDRFFSDHKDYKIVHSHINAMSTPVLRSALHYQIPVRIAHSHTSSAITDLKLPVRVFNKLFIKKYATNYFACSKKAAVWLFGRKAQSEGQVRIIHNAIDANLYAYNSVVRQRLRSDLNLQSKFVVGHVGNFIYPKNHSFLVDIFEKILVNTPDAYMIFVGEGNLQKSVREKCIRMNISDRVLFTGKVSNVNEYLQSFDIFVFPSHYEGLPLTVVEAQAAALPCLISDAISNEVKITGLVRMLSLSQNAEVWADSILNDFDCSERKDISEEIIAHKYDSAIVAKELEDFYLGSLAI